MMLISQRVDRLTRSIINRLSGDSFDTETVGLQKSDLKLLKTGWKFDWKREFRDSRVFKLVLRSSPQVIQGLISISDKGDHIFMNLIESARHNRGKNKVYEGVPGNLVAFACKVSFSLGYDGLVVFEAKTKLVEHYRQTLNAQLITSNRMFIDTKTAISLITMEYIKEPEGVDFVVVPQTKPDPEADRITSEFLARYRAKHKKVIAKIVKQAMEIIKKYDESRAKEPFSDKPNRVIKKGYFKEPEDIDFEVQPSYLNPLTPEEASEFSEFLSEYKLKKETVKKKL